MAALSLATNDDAGTPGSWARINDEAVDDARVSETQSAPGQLREDWNPVDDPPISMTIPTEILQHIFSYLSPSDFNSSRRTCRTWRYAARNGQLIITMTKRAGWWRSMLYILPAMNEAEPLRQEQEHIMSKCISRESDLASVTGNSFEEVGYTDFRGLMPEATPGDLRGALTFTVSLCGRFLLLARGKTVYVYELNHVCSHARSRWIVPLRKRQGLPLGVLRPVSSLHCPRNVISCSMDTSANRNAVAFLMEGRMGMVSDVDFDRLGPCMSPGYNVSWSGARSTAGSSFATIDSRGMNPLSCICRRTPVTHPIRVEDVSRTIYRSICHFDDPPVVVALCPQRHCVAFGSSSGIELHWVDATTGRALSRWFPLISPSDHLYFLPRRQGVDTPKRLRLISSAARKHPQTRAERSAPSYDHNQRLVGSGTTSVVSFMDLNSNQTAGWDSQVPGGIPGYHEIHRPAYAIQREAPLEARVRRRDEDSEDHYRAVPLSDGYHILFTDPRSGNLCLGSDAPVGALSRLLRKAWFRPPSIATSPAPIAYAARADVEHGVRVVATYLTDAHADLQQAHCSGSTNQVVAFYSLGPDIFQDLKQIDGRGQSNSARDGHQPGQQQSEWMPWWPDDPKQAEIFNDPFSNNSVYPLEIRGQVVATCSNVVEVALESSPDMIIWAFSSEGWARTWAMRTGRKMTLSRTLVQADGSLRIMDQEGDLQMAGAEADFYDSSDDDAWLVEEGVFTYDGPTTPGPSNITNHRGGRYESSNQAVDRMNGAGSGPLNVHLIQDVAGIARMTIELQD